MTHCNHPNLSTAPTIGWSDDAQGGYLENVVCPDCKSTRVRCAIARVYRLPPGPLTRLVLERARRVEALDDAA